MILKTHRHLIVLSFTFVLALSYQAFSQNNADELTISVTPILSEDASFPVTPSNKFRLHLENKTGKTIRLNIWVIHLYLKSVGATQVEKTFVAFAQLRNKKIKNNESIEVEAWLDKLHWYYSGSTSFIYSEVPNLLENVGSGEKRLFANVDLPTKTPEYPAFRLIKSNSIKVLIPPAKPPLAELD